MRVDDSDRALGRANAERRATSLRIDAPQLELRAALSSASAEPTNVVATFDRASNESRSSDSAITTPRSSVVTRIERSVDCRS
jgi:hypothetical protein